MAEITKNADELERVCMLIANYSDVPKISAQGLAFALGCVMRKVCMKKHNMSLDEINDVFLDMNKCVSDFSKSIHEIFKD